LKTKAEKKQEDEKKVTKTTAELKALTSNSATPQPTLDAKKTALLAD